MEVDMRNILSLLACVTLVSCTAAGQPVGSRNAAGERSLALTTAGKVAGKPVYCVPSWNSNDMTIIDGQTVGFRNAGGGTSYVVHLSPGCELMGTGHYALLSKKYGTADTCRGDIQQVIDTTAHITVGSCVIGEITPYTRPR
jgi:hypothetical protein